MLVAAAAFLPIGLLAPLGGALADRIARRPVLVGGNRGRGRAWPWCWPSQVSSGRGSPIVLVGLVAVQGSRVGRDRPVPAGDPARPGPAVREFLPAIALNSAQWNLGRIAGPALAGRGHRRVRLPAGLRCQRRHRSSRSWLP